MKNTLITVAAVVATSGMAFAGFDASFLGVTGQGNAVHIDNTASGGTINADFGAGHMGFEYVGAPSSVGAGQFASGTFYTFCMELQSVGSFSTYEVDSIQNGPNPTPAVGNGPSYDSTDESEVHAVIAAAVRLGWLNEDLSAGVNATDRRMAAVQGHVWRVVLDDSVVTANGSILTQWNDLLAEISNDPTARVKGLRGMMSVDAQDQLFIVPLPTAALAGLITLGGIGGFSRIRRR